MRRIGQTLRRYLLENLTAKLMALALAVAIWLYAYNSSRVAPYEVSIPVSVQTSEGWTVEGPLNKTMSVTLSYPRRFLGAFDEALRSRRIRISPRVEPDDSGEDMQTKTIVLGPAHLVSPQAFSIDVVRFEKDTLQVKLIKEAQIAIPVDVVHTPPPDGYEIVGQIWRSPTRVRVRGRKDIVSKAQGIKTEEIDISQSPPVPNVNWSVTRTVPVVLYVALGDDEQQHSVSCDDKVQVRIELQPIPQRKTFKDIPIRKVLSDDYSYKAEIHPDDRKSDVRVIGPATVVSALEPKDIILFVQVSNLEPSPTGLPWRQAIQYKIAGPGGHFLNVEPAKKDCRVTVTKAIPK